LIISVSGESEDEEVDDDEDDEEDDVEESAENSERSDKNSPDDKTEERDNNDKSVSIATVPKEGAASLTTDSKQIKNVETEDKQEVHSQGTADSGNSSKQPHGH